MHPIAVQRVPGVRGVRGGSGGGGGGLRVQAGLGHHGLGRGAQLQAVSGGRGGKHRCGQISCTRGYSHDVTTDGRRCTRCPVSGCGPCPPGHVRLERNIDGAPLGRARCVRCARGTRPDTRGSSCVPCYHWPVDAGAGLNTEPACDCVLKAGLCLPPSLDTEDVYR